jgi:hypothetical protein
MTAWRRIDDLPQIRMDRNRKLHRRRVLGFFAHPIQDFIADVLRPHRNHVLPSLRSVETKR